MGIAESLIKSPHRDKWNGEDLVLSRERVGAFGEVLTPPEIVNEMLDMVSSKDKTIPLEKTFLEPSCGTGNFLVGILSRKLKLCKDKQDIFTAVSTIYGVDIQKDNVLESRLRLLEMVEEVESDESFLRLIADVLEKNIIGGDMLQDKRGCMLNDEIWVRGTVRNATGLVEDDHIPHIRPLAYSWSWNGGTPTKVAEFLVENEEKEVSTSSTTVDMTNLQDRFKSLF